MLFFCSSVLLSPIISLFGHKHISTCCSFVLLYFCLLSSASSVFLYLLILYFCTFVSYHQLVLYFCLLSSAYFVLLYFCLLIISLLCSSVEKTLRFCQYFLYSLYLRLISNRSPPKFMSRPYSVCVAVR